MFFKIAPVIIQLKANKLQEMTSLQYGGLFVLFVFLKFIDWADSKVCS